MNNKDNAIFKLKKAINELNKVLAGNNINVLAISSHQQIGEFIKVFEITLQKILSDSIPPKNERTLGIAHLIADQWPFDLELGSIIIDAEQAYKEI
ncbi:hypothetical protein [Erwinia sp. 9145]|uniref:hypothetical protein n=1 Tax=Erwinia sp. 9145 TaxID=1500895 RepID=UPI00055929CC|nr:hypothetical protein [Erwinia sp. 9145]